MQTQPLSKLAPTVCFGYLRYMGEAIFKKPGPLTMIPPFHDVRRLYLFLLLLAVVSSFPAPLDASQSFIAPAPDDIGAVDIYLLTRGAGKDVYTKYGHTMIRVVDPSHDLDISYNWGTFNFGDKGFIIKFLRGFLLYHLDISPTPYEIRVSQYEGRWLAQERLNLTLKQKAALLAILNRESQPERRYYRYLFFTDNCSTRPRDFIDEAIGGKIAERFKNVKTDRTLRNEVMHYNASVPILAMGQDIMLNSETDNRLSQWEEMFIPLKLRDYLLTMPSSGDDGSVRRAPLLSDTTMLTSFPDPVVPSCNGYQIFCTIIGLPLLLCLLLGARSSFRKLRVRFLGLAAILWGALSGLFGLYLTFSWAFSELTMVFHNANLFVFWPLDWYYVYWGMPLMFKGVPPRSGNSARFSLWLTLGHCIALVVYALLAISGFYDQYVIRVLTYFGPLSLLLFLSLLVFSRQMCDKPCFLSK